MEIIKAKITSVTIQGGQSMSGKPWTKYNYEFDNGVKIASFDLKHYEQFKAGMFVEISREKNLKGYWELKSMVEGVDVVEQTIHPQTEKSTPMTQSSSGIDIRAGQMLEIAMKIYTNDKNVDGVTYDEVVKMVANQFKRVREDFKNSLN